MRPKDQSEQVTWQDGGLPVSTLFDDPYFSLADGLAESRHVFLAGNDLPRRFRDGFHIAELGFGTGLNLMATVIAWESAGLPGRLRYSSFEAYPMPAPDMARALDGFREIADVAHRLITPWSKGARQFALGRVDVEIVEGDARATLPAWNGRADAWYLDGFSPAKNPELWSPDLLAEVARHTESSGSFATYTAAGFVRRGLQAAGFQVERVSGFGHKRHMSRGTFGEA
ncbi:MAG: tRNA (5-methylaminomethyl-2-thiouridine)(34)-methyltransferase MnmD [Albidovulum sp.]